MNRQCYEPIPQRPIDEPIILENIHQHSIPSYPYAASLSNNHSSSPNYSSYNSGLPTSVPSSRAPSVLAPSIPASPPPSFHTHSTPGTPRPTPSTSNRSAGQESRNAQDLWGVAESTVDEGDDVTEIGVGTSNDALATIKSLKKRVEWLEESIGRLLIEKEVSSSTSTGNNRQNCCVTFTAASPDLERLLTTGRGANCCVTFSSQNKEARRERWHKIIAGLTALFLITVMVTVVMSRIGTAQAIAKAAKNGASEISCAESGQC